MLHKSRDQDAILFAEGRHVNALVREVAAMTPSMFRSPCPVFLPANYSTSIELRLDSNAIFYEETTLKDGFELADHYAVVGSHKLREALGAWDKNGLYLSKSKYRWDRRRDLMGARIINTLAVTVSKYSLIVYDDKGNVAGSRGSIPDRGVYTYKLF